MYTILKGDTWALWVGWRTEVISVRVNEFLFSLLCTPEIYVRRHSGVYVFNDVGISLARHGDSCGGAKYNTADSNCRTTGKAVNHAPAPQLQPCPRHCRRVDTAYQQVSCNSRLSRGISIVTIAVRTFCFTVVTALSQTFLSGFYLYYRVVLPSRGRHLLR